MVESIQAKKGNSKGADGCSSKNRRNRDDITDGQKVGENNQKAEGG